MADYGIFGHGSSGNSAFARGLDKFHGHTKKYDPLGHYSVEMPLKGAHWLVEKSSKGLADAGIGTGFNTRLNQEADENGNNFGLGSQRMGLGILSYLGGMYALGGGEAAGGAGSAGGAGGAAPNALGYGLGGSSGYVIPGGGGAAGAGGGAGLGAGTYLEQGGGMVGGNGGNGLSWLNADGTSGTTGALGQGGSGMNWQDMLRQQQGGQKGQQQNYAGGRQNLPLYENEKTDQQKLAELLKALQDQQGAY